MECSDAGKSISIRLLSICAVLALLLFPPSAVHAGAYADSAHGHSSAGVKRTLLAGNYAQGNCAHCHEQHASIDGVEPVPAGGSASPFLTFAGHNAATSSAQPTVRSNNYCFYCHAGSSSVQFGELIDNKDYSATFGGYTTGSPAGIFEAFSYGASHHNLYDLYGYALDNFSAWFKANSNPCLACHNVHIAKRNKSDTDNPVLTAISLPSDHGNLWGDGAGEKISDYSAAYQAPYYYNSVATYEPGATASQDGSLHPDYNTFCLACHSAAITRKSGGTIRAIDWVTTGGDGATPAASAALGDKHGKNSATTELMLDAPYKNIGVGGYPAGGYVLSCLDCHEPHGSSNVWLIRRSVNGAVLSGTVTSDTKTYTNLCKRCHQDNMKTVHHTGSEKPYNDMGCVSCHLTGGSPPPPIFCGNCHGHGSYVNDPLNDDDKTPLAPTTRRTF